jgi:four helix bundle protein
MLDTGKSIDNKNTGMSYKNLEIWQMAKSLSIDIHRMTLTLPKFEQFEEAQQIRRSSKSVRSTIVEGYGRRYYKAEYIKFLIYALSSNDETIDHLETLYECESLTNKATFEDLHKRLQILGRKINNFLKTVASSHERPNLVQEPELQNLEYSAEREFQNQESSIKHPASSPHDQI